MTGGQAVRRSGGQLLTLSRPPVLTLLVLVLLPLPLHGQDQIGLPIGATPLAMPDVPKRSADYFVQTGMDLVDLFVGSEGTLGVLTEVEVRVAPLRPRLGAWVPLASEAQALELVGRLCAASHATWAGGDPNGIDIASIGLLDRLRSSCWPRTVSCGNRA